MEILQTFYENFKKFSRNLIEIFLKVWKIITEHLENFCEILKPFGRIFVKISGF